MQIIPFSSDLIPQAAELLAQRHQRDRAALPDLPPRFEDPAHAGTALEAAMQKPHFSGVAALRNGHLAAYLLGDMVLDALWGRSAWIRPVGLGLAADQSGELLRHLYAALGARGVAAGCFAHFAVIPVADPGLVHLWFSLSFGIEQVHALLNLKSFDLDASAPTLPPGIEIRRAVPADSPLLAEFSDVIWRHQIEAPVWGIHLPESDERDGWAELPTDPGVLLWLAFQGRDLVGTQGYWPADPPPDNILFPDHCAHMSVAGTRPSHRGQGITRALTRYGLAQARINGYQYVETDWRSTNLLASQVWPRQGFRPVAYRLVRRIDPRITWARG